MDVYSLQLQIGVPMVGPSWVHSMLIRDDFPKLGAYLVSPLPGLYVQDFSHFYVTGYAVVNSVKLLTVTNLGQRVFL